MPSAPSTRGPDRPSGPASDDILSSPEAGPRVVRGGAVRGLGYGLGLGLGVATSVLLLRHLGVVEFGRYVTVTALIGIVAGVTDAGLTAVGARELSIRPAGPERERLLSTLLGLRLLITPLGVVVATGFAVLAGYDSVLVLGTLVAGVGLVLINAQATMMLPLSVALRIGSVTAVEVLKQGVLLVGVALLVIAGATLLPFFAIQVAIGVVVLAVTPALVRLGVRMRPALDLETARMLVRNALPVAAALALNVMYLRILVLMMTFLASATATGHFATSFRVIEVLIGIPSLVLSVALPVLAVAGQNDRARLRYVMQRMTEVALIASLGIVIVLVAAAEPAIVLLGGEDYRPAAPVLRLQAVVLVFVFLAQTWQLGLLSIGAQSALAVGNAAALLTVLVGGAVLIPARGASGAAVAAVIGEAVLAIVLLAALRRKDPSLVPSARFGWKVALAVLLAATAGGSVAPALGPVAAAAIALTVYATVVLLTRALPSELLDAFRHRRGRRV